jgi:hypothetical protein
MPLVYSIAVSAIRQTVYLNRIILIGRNGDTTLYVDQVQRITR